MFNVTIIKLKDIIKIGVILILIYVFSIFIYNNLKIKEGLTIPVNFDSSNIIKNGLEQQLGIMQNTLDEESISKSKIKEELKENKDFFKIRKILNFGSNIFSLENSEIKIGQDKENVIENNEDELKEEEQKEVTNEEAYNIKPTTEVVTVNPLAERFDRDYNGVKIKNETDFELTDDILNPENLNINNNNVLIFHTHTCESYTQSESYSYEETRNI